MLGALCHLRTLTRAGGAEAALDCISMYAVHLYLFSGRVTMTAEEEFLVLLHFVFLLGGRSRAPTLTLLCRHTCVCLQGIVLILWFHLETVIHHMTVSL